MVFEKQPNTQSGRYDEVQYFGPDSRTIKSKTLVVRVAEETHQEKAMCSFYCLTLTEKAHEIYHLHMNLKIDKETKKSK